MSAPAETEADRQYFESYEDIESHEIMLKDRPRNKAYLEALHLADLVGKVVLDVGAGAAAFLSMAAARAGAKKVYAVEASRMAENAEAIVQHNGYSEVVEVIRGRIEDIQLPEKVDVIVSEWMGFYLVHESMLNSVLIARDRFGYLTSSSSFLLQWLIFLLLSHFLFLLPSPPRWLKPDGIMLPTTAKIYACPVSMEQFYEEKFQFWEDVEGFDMSGLMPMAVTRALSQPCIRVLEPSQLISVPELIGSIDCRSVKVAELASFTAEPEFIASREGVFHGMALWFTVDFITPKGTERLSTGPEAPATHWKQTTILFPQAFSAAEGMTISSKVSLETNEENPRRYNVTVDIHNPEDDEEEDVDMDAYGSLLQACKEGMGNVEEDEMLEGEEE